MTDRTPDFVSSPARAARAVRDVTRLSLAVAVILVVLKMFGWSASGSVSLLASLLDSGLDLFGAGPDLEREARCRMDRPLDDRTVDPGLVPVEEARRLGREHAVSRVGPHLAVVLAGDDE